MRIAGRRPLAASFPSPGTGATWAGFVVLILLVAALAVDVAPRPRGVDGGALAAPSTTLSMAAAFGLGGLASLDSPFIGDAPSPVVNGQVVAYYGSPRTPAMGLLGQLPPEEVADALAAHAARFDALNGDDAIVPALHLVYAVAQPLPGPDGLYLTYVDDATVRRYLDLARRRGFVLVLDLQIGHSTVLDELLKIDRFLREPDVMVAIDPEFALAGDQLPGGPVGSVTASDINAAQWYLSELVRQERLPRKMLVVHQFEIDMIRSPQEIVRSAGADLVIDMDGYGRAEIKEVKYRRYTQFAPYGGIKIFPQHDPDPLTEQQLLDIEPRPVFFVYQ